MTKKCTSLLASKMMQYIITIYPNQTLCPCCRERDGALMADKFALCMFVHYYRIINKLDCALVHPIRAPLQWVSPDLGRIVSVVTVLPSQYPHTAQSGASKPKMHLRGLIN